MLENRYATLDLLPVDVVILLKKVESSLTKLMDLLNNISFFTLIISLCSSSNFASVTLQTSNSALLIGFLFSGYLSDLRNAQLLKISYERDIAEMKSFFIFSLSESDSFLIALILEFIKVSKSGV